MKVTVTPAHALAGEGQRLDASYHASPGVRALRTLRDWANAPPAATPGAPHLLREPSSAYAARRLDRLADVCVPGGVFIGGRSKRIYVDDPERGIPFLSSSDMLMASFDGVKRISKKQPELDSLILRKGWTLISRSGTIGNTAYVRQDMDGLAGSEHIMRVAPDPDKIPPGYLYAFLSSRLGTDIIKAGTFGSVIDTIDPERISTLPIPRLDAATEARIHGLIEQAAQLRAEANELLAAVNEDLTRAIGPLHTSSFNRPLTYTSLSGQLKRLTAFNNRPDIESARQAVVSSGRYARLGDVTLRIFHPFRMNMVYVTSDRGVPFLNLADMSAARFRATNYMSPLTQGFAEYSLEYGMTLISRSGTIGRICFVGRYLQGAVTNEHISRIVPDSSRIPPGYLYAYMTSPYAQLQVDGLIYGSVILSIYEKELAEILVSLPEEELMSAISSTVEFAFDKRFLANLNEDEAQTLLVVGLGLDSKLTLR